MSDELRRDRRRRGAERAERAGRAPVARRGRGVERVVAGSAAQTAASDAADSAPGSGLARHGQLPPRRAWKGLATFVAAALAVVLVATGSVAAIAVWQLRQNVVVGAPDINDGETVAPPTIGAYEGGFNVLIVGGDADDDRDGERNDVNILVHVSGDQTNAVAVSIPRDLISPFPGCRQEDGTMSSALSGAQINEALSYGGLACAVTWAESLSGLDIQFAGMISFNGVTAMSDAVGGVDVCVAKTIDDDHTGLQLEAGTHTLKGREAMLFLRTRYGVGNGSDLTRISSQQVFMSSLLRKLKSNETLTDPGKLFNLATAATKNMTLSKELADPNTLVAMARALDNIDLSKVAFVQYPTYYLDGELAGKVGTSTDAAAELFAKIQADEPIKLARAGDGEGSAEAGSDGAGGEGSGGEGAGEGTGDGGTEQPAPDPTATDGADDGTLGDRTTGQTADQQTCSVGNGP